VERVNPFLSEGGIPTVVGPNCARHLTLAGQLVNQAIAVAAGDTSAASDDICCVSARILEPAALPSAPEEFGPYLPSLTHQKEELTLFQTLLPRELVLRELAESWLKTPAHRDALTRIRNGKVRRVEPSALDGLI